MASEELNAVFSAVETISDTLDKIGRSVTSLENDLSGLDASMAGNSAISQQHQQSMESLGSTINDLETEIDSASRSFQKLTGMQQINVASAATQAGAMYAAGRAIDEAGDDALKTAGQMKVLDTVMKELSLSGSALSVNIGAFNVSLRNLAPLVPIVATMGSAVAVIGAFVSALGAATIALAGFTAGGAIGFLEDMQEEFDGLTDSAETLEAVMGGIKDLFVEALEPLQTAEDTEFFVNLIEGLADLTNRLAQAIDQMRDVFMPLFTGIADIIGDEFDNVANGIEDMMETMNPVLLNFFEWFMVKLPDALRFMARITSDLDGPVGNLGNSLLDLVTSIIRTATQVFQGLAPAFAVASDIMTELVDLFNSLSNGLLQAAVLFGGLTLAATKFVGIADTIANIGLTAAQQWVNFGKGATSGLAGARQAAASYAQDTFKHLRALGKVMTGQMALADATGQTHKDLADDIKQAAEEVQRLEGELEDVQRQYATLVASVEGTNVGEAMEESVSQTQLTNFADSVDDTAVPINNFADSVDDTTVPINNLKEAARDMDSTLTGIEFDPDMLGGGQFREIDTGNLISSDAARKSLESARDEVDDVVEGGLASPEAIGAGFDALDDAVDDNRAIRPNEVIGGVGRGGLDGEQVDVSGITDKFDTLRDGVESSTSRIGSSLETGLTKFGRFSNSVAESANSVLRSVKGMAVMPFKKVSSGVDKATDSLTQMFLRTDAGEEGVGALITNLDRMAQSSIEAATDMVMMPFRKLSSGIDSMNTGIIKSIMAQAGLRVQSIKSTIALIRQQIATKGVIGATKAMTTSLWGTVAAMLSTQTGAMATAATFIGGLIPASISTGTALNIAFAGIPTILGAIVAAAALVVGVLGNMDGITSGLKGTFNGLKSAIAEIGDALLNVGVPAWNLFLEIIEAALAPFLAIWDGIKLIGQALGIMSEEGGGLGSIIGTLIDGFGVLMGVIGDMISFVMPAFDMIGSILYNAFIIPFQVIAGTIRIVMQLLQGLVAIAIDKIPFMSELVSGLQTAFQGIIEVISQIPAFFDTVAQVVGGTIDALVSGIRSALEPAVDFINGLIDKANKTPGVDIDNVSIDGFGGGGSASDALSGAQTTTAEVRENVASDEEEPGDDVATEPVVNMSLDDTVENNVEVDADPEDKAQLSRITKDAIEEANSFARRQQGGQ